MRFSIAMNLCPGSIIAEQKNSLSICSKFYNNIDGITNILLRTGIRAGRVATFRVPGKKRVCAALLGRSTPGPLMDPEYTATNWKRICYTSTCMPSLQPRTCASRTQREIMRDCSDISIVPCSRSTRRTVHVGVGSVIVQVIYVINVYKVNKLQLRVESFVPVI